MFCHLFSLFPSSTGPPESATLNNLTVSAQASSGDEYTLTFVANFTDHSKVPVTKIKYVVNQTKVARNISVQVS